MQGSPKKLLSTAHTSRNWRIHVLTNDFRVEDVWSLPTLGGPDDVPRLVAGTFGTVELGRCAMRRGRRP